MSIYLCLSRSGLCNENRFDFSTVDNWLKMGLLALVLEFIDNWPGDAIRLTRCRFRISSVDNK